MKVPFRELFADETKRGRKLQTGNYLSKGAHPIIDQGHNQVAGYTDLEEGLFNDVPAIVFGDHTRIVKYVDEPFFLGADGTKILRPRQADVNPRYLYHYLASTSIPNTGYSRHFKWLKELVFDIPSLPEQRRIAAVLDQADALIANYRSQLALLDTLAQSRFHELFGDMVTNSKQWPIRKLSDIAEYYNGLNYKPIDVSLEGTVVLRAGNIQNQALVLDDTVRVKIPIKERYLVKENDILMCACNGSIQLVGKSAIIPRLLEPMYFGSFMKIIRTPYPEYVQAFFQTLAFRRQIQTAKTTTINQITNQMMDLIELPFPPLSLIEDFNRQITKLKAQKEFICTSLCIAETLRVSMMQKFFK